MTLALTATLALAGCGAGETSDGDAGSGGTMLATAFPLSSVLQAAEASLPAEVTIGEIPRDVRWLPGNQIEVPVERRGETAVLVVTVLPEQETCDAESPVLDDAEAAAVAEQVCATWRDEGRLPVVVPDPDAPIVEDPSDAAR